MHSYIENADQKKVKAIYALLENEIEHDEERFIYDEDLLAELEKTSDDAFSGRVKTLSVKQSMENIGKHRKKNGV